MNTLKKLLMDATTEPDNDTFCPIRIGAILGFTYGFVTHGYAIFVLKHPFDWLVFWQGFGIGLGALGIALGVKKDTGREAK